MLTLLLILAISAQPVQAGFCAMDMSQDSASGMAHHVDMEDSDDHGCCDPGTTDSDEDCESGMHCGLCTAAVPLLPELPKIASWLNHVRLSGLDSGILPPSHASPPFRPPIA